MVPQPPLRRSPFTFNKLLPTKIMRTLATIRTFIGNLLINHCSFRFSFSLVFVIYIVNFGCNACYTVHHGSSVNYVSGDVYHSPKVFSLNYEDMEKNFKVYIYPGLVSDSLAPRSLKGKYASEGYFLQNIEASMFRTYNPEQAHLFLVPFSFHNLRREGKSLEDISDIFQLYIESLISKYPYWNRTLGADHFFVSCHDAGLKVTERVSLMVKNSIRVVCSAGYDISYIPHKDVSLPQVIEPSAPEAGRDDTKSRSNRTILGFWKGRSNSKIRDTLVRLWKNDIELDIQKNDRKKDFYLSKFCICPVILSNYYDLPFSAILDWRKFSVIVNENDVHQLKSILKNISEADYINLRSNLLKVQKHFQWNSDPVRSDAFHMVMYELWLRHYLIKY